MSLGGLVIENIPVPALLFGSGAAYWGTELRSELAGADLRVAADASAADPHWPEIEVLFTWKPRFWPRSVWGSTPAPLDPLAVCRHRGAPVPGDHSEPGAPDQHQGCSRQDHGPPRLCTDTGLGEGSGHLRAIPDLRTMDGARRGSAAAGSGGEDASRGRSGDRWTGSGEPRSHFRHDHPCLAPPSGARQ